MTTHVAEHPDIRALCEMVVAAHQAWKAKEPSSDIDAQLRRAREAAERLLASAGKGAGK